MRTRSAAKISPPGDEPKPTPKAQHPKAPARRVPRGGIVNRNKPADNIDDDDEKDDVSHDKKTPRRSARHSTAPCAEHVATTRSARGRIPQPAVTMHDAIDEDDGDDTETTHRRPTAPAHTSPSPALNSRAELDQKLTELNATLGNAARLKTEIQSTRDQVRRHDAFALVGGPTAPVVARYPPPQSLLDNLPAQHHHHHPIPTLASFINDNPEYAHHRSKIDRPDEQVGDILIELSSHTRIFPPSAAASSAQAMKSLFDSILNTVESNIDHDNGPNVQKLNLIVHFVRTVVNNLRQPSLVLSDPANVTQPEIRRSLLTQRNAAYHAYNEALQHCQNNLQHYCQHLRE